MPTDFRGSSLPAPPRAVRRRALSPAVMTVFSLVGAALVVASNSAVTPLYRLYQQSMHLTPLMITLVYAVYTFSLLAALLTVGGLSDYVGRRPVILSGLLLNAIAMVLFSYATDVGQLILARAVQGLCVGTDDPSAGRCNSRHRPQTRTLAQQRHGISRADGWRARCCGPRHLRARSAASGL
jgi:MFS family permease